MPTLFLMRALGVILMTLVPSQQADAQIIKKLKKTVTDAAGSEVLTQTDRVVREQVRCVFDDLECIREAEESGEEAVLTDDSGEVLVDETGAPVSDPEEGAGIAQDKQVKPGEGAWANYDFVPGDEILVYEDFTSDKVGDFPRRFELVTGTWEIVDWEGGRYLRATANGLVAVPLPRQLPERFTLEMSINLQHGGAFARLTTGRAWFGTTASYRGSAISIEPHRAGLRPVRGAGPESMGTLPSNLLREEIVPIRVMADGDHVRVYVGEQRVANAPNAVFPRTDTLFLALNAARVQHPILVGTIRIAGGGRDLYDRLAKEGRVATQGILFASNSDRIRPESTPTLEEIGRMLTDHPELRIAIEGHTDSDGEDDYNQALSERRAAAVKAFMVETYGIAEARLQAGGFGESRPVADNANPEGKQQNRRVELVRLEQ